MAISWTALFVLISATPLSLAALMEESVHQIERRDAYYGGYAMNQYKCPTGSYNRGEWCCPDGDYFKQHINVWVCCPTNADCGGAVEAKPTCADPSWSLFVYNDTESKVFTGICCPSGGYINALGSCADPALGPVGLSSQTLASGEGFSTATQANDAKPPKTKVAAAISAEATASEAAAATETDAAATGADATAAGTGSVPTGGSAPSTAAAPASTAKKSSGYKALSVPRSLGAAIGLLFTVM